MSPKPFLNILVALQCEAQPLLQFYKLKKAAVTSMPLYAAEHDDCTIQLLVTGIGRVNMATAVGWLGARTAGSPAAWLNVGTAGHLSWPLATPVRVAYCEGEPSSRGHYPPLTAAWSGEVGRLMTGDHVCTDYPEQSLVDMEGSAFFAAATRYAHAELVQAVKVVSDNRESGAELLDSAKLTSLMQANTQVIAAFAAQLLELLRSWPNTHAPQFLKELDHLRLTSSQTLQAHDLVQKLVNCGFDETQLREHFMQAASGKAVLQSLHAMLLSTAPSLNQTQQTGVR